VNHVYLGVVCELCGVLFFLIYYYFITGLDLTAKCER
jgi:hypothetical protein